ncbi:MAG: cytochrome c oxidase subunit II [Tepidiforma sp.]|jgi:cytochrome c oxidase subunit 2|nr:cytochrome c oxidase subunit II [Tepidiforma sp.]GIW17710.1 MAG: cytochrome c oxidase subunit II [Tepidiforma sp.]
MPSTGKLRVIRRVNLLISAALLAIASISPAFAGWGMPEPITDQAKRIQDLWVFTLIIALAVFFAVEGALLYAIFRYRKRSDELPKQTHGSTALEIVWTTIPVLIVITLFSYSFIVLRDVEKKAPSDALSIEVDGFQFSWQFTYDLARLGQGQAPAQEGTFSIIGTAAQEPTFVIPVGEPVEFRLKSNDVIHSFYLPNFHYKLDVVPGRDNRFVITANQTGEFTGQCAELCGINHALMRFHVRVVERAEFDKWVAEQVANKATVRQP